MFYKSIIIQFIISTPSHFHSVSYNGWTKLFLFFPILFFLVMISSIENRSKKSPINAALIHYDTIFLIIPCETSNGYNTINATWQITKVEKLHLFGLTKWSLLIVKNVPKRVHPCLIV